MLLLATEDDCMVFSFAELELELRHHVMQLISPIGNLV